MGLRLTIFATAALLLPAAAIAQEAQPAHPAHGSRNYGAPQSSGSGPDRRADATPGNDLTSPGRPGSRYAKGPRPM